MRWVVALVVCGALSLCVAGCNPDLEGRYFREGIGTDLYRNDLPNATALLNQYIDFICGQAGLVVADVNGVPASCNDRVLQPNEWMIFVQAGMNDIDKRCDAYLAWLDNKKRLYTPIQQEITDVYTATNAVLTAIDVGTTPLGIVTAAFGLATNTLKNVNSRLVLEVNQSTVQSLVLTSQNNYRYTLLYGSSATSPPTLPAIIVSRPAAIYVLRSYLRLCMPFTIETQINTNLTAIDRGDAPGIYQVPLVTPATVPAAALRQSIPPQGPRGPLPGVGRNPPVAHVEPKMAGTAFEANIPQSRGRIILRNLCVPFSTDFNSARDAIRQAKLGDAAAGGALFTNNENIINGPDEALIFVRATVPTCVFDSSKDGYQTAFEKFGFPNKKAVEALQDTLAKKNCDPSVAPNGTFDKATRKAIAAVKAKADPATKKTFLFPDTNTLDEKSFEWVSGFCG
jgi:hypothetical protein